MTIQNTDVYFVVRNNIFKANGSGVNSGLYLNNVINGYIKNNTASYNSQYGFFLFNSSSNTLTNNIVSYNNNIGIFLSSSSNNNTLINNIANYNIFYGIYLVSSSNNNTLTKNTASDNSLRGFVLSSSSNNTLISNTAGYNVESGFYLFLSSNNNTLINNNASYNSLYGFYLLSSSNDNTLTNNTASYNVESGFYILYSSFNIFKNNIASFNSLYGINLEGSNRNILSNNKFSNNSQYGFFLEVFSDSNTLVNNAASYNSLYGFSLEESGSNILTNNAANYNFDSGFSLSSSSNNNILTSNNGSYNSLYGFFLSSSSINNDLTKNNANYNFDSGFFLSSSSNNNILTNNTASYNSDYGIYLSLSNSNLIQYNLIKNNTDYGLVVSGTSNRVIWNDFIGNRIGSTSQSLDLGDNRFIANFWDEWEKKSLDIDGNGYLDDPYWIDGLNESAYTTDPFPLTNSIFSTETNIALTVPSSPQNLTITAGTDFVYLQWETPSNNGGASIAEYYIYRGTSSGNYILNFFTTNLFINDTLATAGVTYYYVITALNSVGESVYSAEIYATPIDSSIINSVSYIPAPENLTAISGETWVLLSWIPPTIANGQNIKTYNIYRGESAGSYFQVGNTQNTNYNDTSAEISKTYYYMVTAATDKGDQSLPSNIVIIIVSPDGSSVPGFSVFIFLGGMIIFFLKRKSKSSK